MKRRWKKKFKKKNFLNSYYCKMKIKIRDSLFYEKYIFIKNIEYINF